MVIQGRTVTLTFNILFQLNFQVTIQTHGTFSSWSFIKWQDNVFEALTNVISPMAFFPPFRLHGCVINTCAAHTAVHMHTAVQATHCRPTQAGRVHDASWTCAV